MGFKLKRPLLGWLGAMLVFGLAMTGCGQKGDLYLPDQQPKQSSQ